MKRKPTTWLKSISGNLEASPQPDLPQNAAEKLRLRQKTRRRIRLVPFPHNCIIYIVPFDWSAVQNYWRYIDKRIEDERTDKRTDFFSESTAIGSPVTCISPRLWQ